MDTPAPVAASQSTVPGASQSVAPAQPEEPKPIPVENPDVKVIIELLNVKKYVLQIMFVHLPLVLLIN